MITDEWKQYIFSDFVEINPPLKFEISTEYSFIEMKDLYPSSKFVYPSSKKILSGGSRFQENDTLFARITPCLENGKICQVKNLDDGKGFGSTEFLVFRGKQGISDTNFVYYLARFSDVHQFGIKNMTGTSGRQRVGKNAFRNLILELPPLAEQRAIADVLSALDDKIELNRRMNATLEQLAQTLFKHWFIDNPEREEWDDGIIGNDFNLVMGQSPPGTTYNEIGEGIPFFQGRADFGFRYPDNRVYCTAPTRFAKAGDTLVSVRAPVGDINIAFEDCAIGRGLAAIRHKTGSRSFTYYTMQMLKSEFENFEMEGTVFGSINKDSFSSLKLSRPPFDLVRRFEETYYPLDQQIEVNTRESRALAELRDTLLPKLMTGQVRVKPYPDGS